MKIKLCKKIKYSNLASSAHHRIFLLWLKAYRQDLDKIWKHFEDIQLQPWSVHHRLPTCTQTSYSWVTEAKHFQPVSILLPKFKKSISEADYNMLSRNYTISPCMFSMGSYLTSLLCGPKRQVGLFPESLFNCRSKGILDSTLCCYLFQRANVYESDLYDNDTSVPDMKRNWSLSRRIVHCMRDGQTKNVLCLPFLVENH